MGRLGGVVALAVAAVALLAAQGPNAVANEHQNAASSSISKGVRNVAATNYKKAERTHRAQYEAECDPGYEKRDSDLCAQWKAADAAADSAWWAARGTWISGISGLLVLIALGFAFEANHIARRTAKRQLRAYVHLKSADLCRCAENNFPTDCKHPEQRFADVEIENFGLTPARKLVTACGVGIRPYPPSDFKNVIPDWVDRAVSELPPGRTSGLPLEITASGALHDRLLSGELAVYFWSQVTYEDVFGEEHHTFISLISHGVSFKRGSFYVAKEGNDSD